MSVLATTPHGVVANTLSKHGAIKATVAPAHMTMSRDDYYHYAVGHGIRDQRPVG